MDAKAWLMLPADTETMQTSKPVKTNGCLALFPPRLSALVGRESASCTSITCRDDITHTNGPPSGGNTINMSLSLRQYRKPVFKQTEAHTPPELPGIQNTQPNTERERTNSDDNRTVNPCHPVCWLCGGETHCSSSGQSYRDRSPRTKAAMRALASSLSDSTSGPHISPDESYTGQSTTLERHLHKHWNIFSSSAACEDDRVLGRLNSRFPISGSCNTHKTFDKRAYTEISDNYHQTTLCPATYSRPASSGATVKWVGDWQLRDILKIPNRHQAFYQ